MDEEIGRMINYRAQEFAYSEEQIKAKLEK